MSKKLPIFSGVKLCKILEKFGYFVDHQTGSHIVLRNINSPYRRLTIPNHQEIAKGTLRKAGLTPESLRKIK